MPPEMDEVDIPRVISKSDIFQLGMLLWLLAENKPQTHASPVCGRMRCNGRRFEGEDRDNNCDFSHAEPIALPQLPKSVPKYFRDIVDACRRADPGTRPAAREILENFLLRLRTLLNSSNKTVMSRIKYVHSKIARQTLALLPKESAAQQ